MGELWRRLIALVQRGQMDRELERELQFHLDMKGAETGDPRNARKAVGSSLAWRERTRDVLGCTWLDETLRDIRFTLRGVRQSPGFAAAVILTLALGIGANCLMFSVVDATIVRPFPVREPERLAIVWASSKGSPRNFMSRQNYQHLRANNQVFEEVGAELSATFDIGRNPYPERVLGERVTASYLQALGTQAQVGRLFLPEDEDGSHESVILISDRLWRTRFGADPNVVGSTVVVGINGVAGASTIVGVLPLEIQSGFLLPRDIWLPLQPDREVEQRRLSVIARLKPGVSFATADAALRVLSEGLPEIYRNEKVTATLESWQENLTVYGRSFMFTLAGAVGFVLLIACLNVANLMLARGAERTRELTIRSAIGAGRRRLFLQLLTESAVYGLLGGAVGTILAYASVGMARGLIPPQILRRDSVAVDGRALAFTLVLSLLASILFGLIPAWRASRSDVRSALVGLRGGGRERTWLRSGLIVAEIALSLVLVTSAGLMIQSLLRLIWKDVGFDRADLLTLQTGMPLTAYRTPAAAEIERRITEQLQSLPGVQSVGIADFRPLGNSSMNIAFRKSSEDSRHGAAWAAVTPDYFAAMRIPLRSGRLFNVRDDKSAASVAIISEQVARLYWPNENPLGKSILIPSEGKDVTREVVGVVGDTVGMILDDKRSNLGTLYVPHVQDVRTSALNIVVRVEPGISTATLIPAIRTELAGIDRALSVEGVSTMQSVIYAQLARPRFLTAMLGAFGFLALVLTITGVVGVVAYMVRARTYEFGVRMALGATQSRVRGLILGYGVRLAVAGIILGTAGAVAATRLLASFLYGVQATDLTTMVLGLTILLVAVMAACYVPARRVLRIDPAQALRLD